MLVSLKGIRREEVFKEIIDEVTSLIEHGYIIEGVRILGNYERYISIRSSKGTVSNYDHDTTVTLNKEYLNYILYAVLETNKTIEDIPDSRVFLKFDLYNREYATRSAMELLTMINNDYICTDIIFNDEKKEKGLIKLEYNCYPGGKREQALKLNDKFDDFMELAHQHFYKI